MKKMSNDLERKWSNFLTSLENNQQYDQLTKQYL